MALKKVLKKYNYPPDKRNDAVETVLEQGLTFVCDRLTIVPRLWRVHTNCNLPKSLGKFDESSQLNGTLYVQRMVLPNRGANIFC